MPGSSIPLAVDASTFAGLDPDVYPDGQRVTVTDDGEKEYEARGADGSRSWILLHEGHVDDHEAADDPHAGIYQLAGDEDVWMPLTTVVGGTPELVWDDDNSLIPTKVPT